MGLIPSRDIRLLSDHLASKLENPVTIDFFTQAHELQSQAHTRCPFCGDTEELLHELASLSGKIRLQVHEFSDGGGRARECGITRIPSLMLTGSGRGGVRFIGLPNGFGFSALVDDLVDLSRGTTDLPPQAKAELARVEHPVHIQVFGTPACPHCPRASRMAHKIAIECMQVTADAIEVAEFPDLAHRYGITSVPRIVINETVAFSGIQPFEVYLDAIQRTASA
jgi:glutaredoxin-like protein